jgi:hypothetical protein
VPGAFKPPLKTFVGARGVRGVGALSGVAVKVGQELVAELFRFMSKLCVDGISPTTLKRLRLVGELGPLSERAH